MDFTVGSRGRILVTFFFGNGVRLILISREDSILLFYTCIYMVKRFNLSICFDTLEKRT